MIVHPREREGAVDMDAAAEAIAREHSSSGRTRRMRA